jgi:hypothetical protein
VIEDHTLRIQHIKKITLRLNVICETIILEELLEFGRVKESTMESFKYPLNYTVEFNSMKATHNIYTKSRRNLWQCQFMEMKHGQ